MEVSDSLIGDDRLPTMFHHSGVIGCIGGYIQRSNAQIVDL